MQMRKKMRRTYPRKQGMEYIHGGNKMLKLSYHMGRHSFASLVTLEEGVPIETICKMLGHSNIKTTQIYARVTPKRLFEDMDRFVEATCDLKLIL